MRPFFFFQILKGKYIVIMLDELRKPRPLAFGFHIKKIFFQGEKITKEYVKACMLLLLSEARGNTPLWQQAKIFCRFPSFDTIFC